MVQRGVDFVACAMWLKKEGGHGYVWRHNLGQAIELILKGVLLLKDFDTYWPKRRTLGHRLVALSDAAAEAFGLNAPRGALREELATLSALYERHLLRYASGLWQLVDLGTVGYDRLLRRLCAVLRLLRRWEANIDDRGTI